jgi:hypothetical protein
MTEPIAKRADQLVVGDRIPDEHLAFRFDQGPAAVVFLALEDVSTLPWVFVAYRYPNGQHDSMTIRPEAVLQVYPADMVGGHAAVEVCNWCPDPLHPDPARHPDNGPAHVEPPCWHGEVAPGRDCPGSGPDCGPAF